MHIHEIIRQHRRDFVAIYKCEHCGKTKQGEGYDDAYFHANVIPEMTCSSCGKQADESYKPLATKYPEGFHI